MPDNNVAETAWSPPSRSCLSMWSHRDDVTARVDVLQRRSKTDPSSQTDRWEFAVCNISLVCCILFTTNIICMYYQTYSVPLEGVNQVPLSFTVLTICLRRLLFSMCYILALAPSIPHQSVFSRVNTCVIQRTSKGR